MKGLIVLATPPTLSHRTSEENLGLGYLASTLREKGYQVRVIDCWLQHLTAEELSKEILSLDNLLWVGFSCYRSNLNQAKDVMQLVRSQSPLTKFIAGGYGPTFHYEEFLYAGFDLVVIGEGEQKVVPITKAIESSYEKFDNLPGIAFIQNDCVVKTKNIPAIEPLDGIPFPSRDTLSFALKTKASINITSSRGCAAACLFCSIVSFENLSSGPKWRQRSIESFVDELEFLASRGCEYFKVIDDSFIEPPRSEEWCKLLADEILSRGLRMRLRGSIRADRVTDRILFHLKRAGFYSFSVGVENFSDSALWRMRKKATKDQNIRAITLFEKHNIHMQAGHILFDYGTTLTELRENCDAFFQFSNITSKGIFTELYSAKGTPIDRFLAKRGLKIGGEDEIGNSEYQILDHQVYAIYLGLKKWHKANMAIYDKAIDVITAPKAISSEGFLKFHEISTRLRVKDISLFDKILSLSETGEPNSIDNFVTNSIKSSKDWYRCMKVELDELYTYYGLSYQATENPFVK